MENVELQILRKKQQLRTLLIYVSKQSPIFLFLIRDIKAEIDFCDYMLVEFYAQKANIKIS